MVDDEDLNRGSGCFQFQTEWGKRPRDVSLHVDPAALIPRAIVIALDVNRELEPSGESCLVHDRPRLIRKIHRGTQEFRQPIHRNPFATEHVDSERFYVAIAIGRT